MLLVGRNFDGAEQVAPSSEGPQIERIPGKLQIGTEVPLYLALMAMAYAAAYAGDASDARRAANAALDIGKRAELAVMT